MGPLYPTREWNNESDLWILVKSLEAIMAYKRKIREPEMEVKEFTLEETDRGI